MNKAPPPSKLKSAKKATAKAREGTKAIKTSVGSTTPPRVSTKAVPTVTPGSPRPAVDVPREIVTVPSVPLLLEDEEGAFDGCFDLNCQENTLDQDDDDLDAEVKHQIDSAATDTEDESSNMVGTRNNPSSPGGDSVTTISKSSLQCLQNEKNELNEQLGNQLKLNKEAKAEIESLKKTLEELASSKDGNAKAAEHALKISGLTSQLASLQEQYDKYLADTTQEIEALKKERPAGDPSAAAALEKSKKKTQDLARQLKIAKNEASHYANQLKSLKASSKGKGGGKEVDIALAKAKKALADEAKAKQALERNLRAYQKSNEDLKKQLEEAKKSVTLGDDDSCTPQDYLSKIDELQEALNEQVKSKDAAIAKYKEALKSKEATEKLYNDLVDSNKAMREKLHQCYKVLREKGKAIEAEISPEVKKAARTELREVVFRKVKIVNSKNKKNDEVKDLIQMVYDGIKEERMFEVKTLPNSTQKNPDYLTFEEFQRIYQKDILQYFSTLRSTVQTACKDAVMRKKCNFGLCRVMSSFSSVTYPLSTLPPRFPSLVRRARLCSHYRADSKRLQPSR